MITKEEAEKLYADLIQLRRSDVLIKSKDNPGAIEIHHILPKSCGGSNDTSNLIALYAKEHFMAHVYLWIIHHNDEFYYQMLYAVIAMSMGTCNGLRSNLREFILASEEYQKAREEIAQIFSEQCWYYNPKTNECNKFIENHQPYGWIKGRIFSNLLEFSNNVSKHQKNTVWIVNKTLSQQKHVKREEAEYLVNTGLWEYGHLKYSEDAKIKIKRKILDTWKKNGRIINNQKQSRHSFCLNCGKPNSNLYSQCCCDQCTKEYKDKKAKQLIELKRKKEAEQLEKTRFFRAQITELYKGIVDRKQVKRYLEYKGIVKCQHCGKEHVKLIVHSKDNNPKNLALDNYELLCRDCYNKVSTFGYYNYNNIRKQNKEK